MRLKTPKEINREIARRKREALVDFTVAIAAMIALAMWVLYGR